MGFFLAGLMGLDDLGGFGKCEHFPLKKISANGCGFIEKCSVQLLPYYFQRTERIILVLL